MIILQELSALVLTNEADIEAKFRSNTADLDVRQVKNQLCYIGKQMFFVIPDPEYKGDL